MKSKISAVSDVAHFRRDAREYFSRAREAENEPDRRNHFHRMALFCSYTALHHCLVKTWATHETKRRNENSGSVWMELSMRFRHNAFDRANVDEFESEAIRKIIRTFRSLKPHRHDVCHGRTTERTDLLGKMENMIETSEWVERMIANAEDACAKLVTEHQTGRADELFDFLNRYHLPKK